MMEFIKWGFDIYRAEVDCHGIDFIIRKNDEKWQHVEYYDVQVKSSRNLNYIFFPKEKFTPRDKLYAAIVLFLNGNPQLFLIPSKAWENPSKFLVSRDYKGKKSKPEWGLNLSRSNLRSFRKRFAFDKVIQAL